MKCCIFAHDLGWLSSRWQCGVAVNPLVVINEVTLLWAVGPVSAEMGDCLREGKPSLCVTNYLCQLKPSIPPG